MCGMEDDIHPNDDKETLRRRLELLKQEYERTARRLQRAEHWDAVRRQSSVSHQDRFTHNESSPCSTSSFIPAELSDNQVSDIVAERNSSVFSTVKKIPAIQFQLSEISSPACKRSPAHRLRSKRSRLRLKNKERESDTDNSQEKESLIQGKNVSVDKETKLRKERDVEMLPAKVEKNQDLLKNEKTDDKVSKKSQEPKMTEKTEDNCEFKYGALDSCTLVEGLPFPVEYYIRTTRRMAASQSSVNLEAVIHSQLSGGRGRRRLGQSQTRGRGHVTTELSETVCRSTNLAGRRGNGKRKRRGCRRTTVARSSCSKSATDCTISHHENDSQADCSLLMESTPQAESTCQSELEERPQAESQPIQSSGSIVHMKPSKEEEDITQDFKHLPDSQLYFESKLLPDSNLYPIFRRGRGETGKDLAQSQTCVNKHDQSPLLPSLPSLIQALQEKDTKNGLLAAVDVQDFHLPDEDFGQLKLEKLRLSTAFVEPFVQRVYNTRRSNRRQTASGRKSNCEELFTPEPPTSSVIEDSLPLCQSDPIDQSETETQNTDQSDNTVKVQTTSTNQMHTLTILNKDIKTENVKINVNINPQEQSQTDSHTLSENSSCCPALLDFSPLLTSPTQRGLDPALPSLGMTPHFFSPGSPMALQPQILSPPDSRRSPSLIIPTCVSPDSVSSKTLRNVKANTSMKNSCDPTKVEEDTGTPNKTKIRQETKMRAQNNANPQTPHQNNIATGQENIIAPETEMQALCILESEQKNEGADTENKQECGSNMECTPEIKAQLQNVPESESCNTKSESAVHLIPDIHKTQNNLQTDGQTNKHTELRAETQSYMVMNLSRCGDEAGQTPNEMISSDILTSQTKEDKTANADEAMEHGTDSPETKTLLNDEPVADHCSSMLREMHTFKALEGGCVLDLCLVRWALEDLCICVAGEWSVCLWTQKKGLQPWSLLYTWTFSQSVMSLQAIPDSLGLLCVTLGHLEITEARVLCCPSIDGPFSQTVVCKDALQAVVGVSNCRLVSCSTPGDQQNVTVITLTKEGRVVNTLTLAPAKQNIRTLAAVEGEKDALIGWTECKTLLIWNMKTGHLLQTVYLEKTLTMTNCMRGYFYRGVLCVLLQNTGNVCDEKSNTTLFMLIATNTLTGKHITLTSINNPAQHIQQLIDGDVFGSGLVGVFQSGHVAVWDLRGKGVKVVGVLDELCRLARWAGTDTLLTGYLNGDVSVFQYKNA